METSSSCRQDLLKTTETGETSKRFSATLRRYRDLLEIKMTGETSHVDVPNGAGVAYVTQMYPKVKTECVDIIKDTERRDTLIKQHDIVLGLIPCPMMPEVLRACLRLKKHFLSPSYLTEETKDLHEEVKEAGLTFLLELGLDPGIDHMLAMKTCDDIRRKGGRVSSYEMWCGGLPAPENAQDNPLQYKFSWYPKGALASCIEGGGFMKDKKGFSTAVLPLLKLGLFGDTPHELLTGKSMQHSWRNIICHEMGVHSAISNEDLEKRILDKLGNQEDLIVCKRLGLLSDDVIEVKETLLDTLAIFLESKPEFVFDKMQRDLVLMHIKVEGKYPDGSQESRHLDLTVYGDPGKYSAMTKTVGHTIASIVMLLVKGEITGRGIVLPVSENVYVPVLVDLNKKGITVTEKIVPGEGN